jgi:hypothetical protein
MLNVGNNYTVPPSVSENNFDLCPQKAYDSNAYSIFLIDQKRLDHLHFVWTIFNILENTLDNLGYPTQLKF